MAGYKKKLGQFGEQLARKYLTGKGYCFLESNWQKRCGEIDLIFLHQNEIIFVEVKTRTKNYCGYGEDAVNFAKKEKISRAIDSFLAENEKYQTYSPRFEIVVVELFSLTPRFIHYEFVEL
jgi:putative endonuclease